MRPVAARSQSIVPLKYPKAPLRSAGYCATSMCLGIDRTTPSLTGNGGALKFRRSTHRQNGHNCKPTIKGATSSPRKSDFLPPSSLALPVWHAEATCPSFHLDILAVPIHLLGLSNC